MTRLPPNQIALINSALSSIHVKANSHFTEIQFQNTFYLTPELYKSLFLDNIVEYTGDQWAGTNQPMICFTKNGKKLVELRDWDAYIEWVEALPSIVKAEKENEYLRALEKAIKEQQLHINAMELKMKPENHRISKIALILAVISLLTSVGLVQWLLRCIQTTLK